MSVLKKWLAPCGLAGVLLMAVLTLLVVPQRVVDADVLDQQLPEDGARTAIVAYFAAMPEDSGVRFTWSTATEIANAGFNLYAVTAVGREQLNEDLILSQAVDSMSGLDYTFSAESAAQEFYLEVVDVNGVTRLHGPFGLGEPFGARIEPDTIDWAAIRAEQVSQGIGSSPTGSAVENAGALSKSALGGQLAYPEFALGVKEDGIYRVTYEDLKSATGVGLLGVPARSLALTNQGQAVPMRITGGRIMKPGVALEFVGEGLDTLYTRENVYILQVNRDLYSKMPSFTKSIPANATSPEFYMETAAFERDNYYSVSSVSGDPWYDTMMHTAKAKTWRFSLEVDYLVSGGTPSLDLALWGASHGNHHVVAAINGAEVADINFSGRVVESTSAPVSNLKAGVNTLELTVPNDQGATTDSVALEGYGLTYPRAFVAQDGRLGFAADAAAFTVSGLIDSNVVVYQVTSSGPQRISAVSTTAVGGEYEATFPGNGAGTYFVSSAGSMLRPSIMLATPPGDITSGVADLLIISHPSFVEGLARLVEAREAQGYVVKVVDVNAIYRTYSGGVFDAEAIRQYVTHAIDKLGVAYVLLVGADTNDYLGVKESVSRSFVPTLYAETSANVRFDPVDPLYTDVDGDNVPDAAIGRFPVRLTSELEMMVDKTLLYGQHNQGQTAVFAADDGFGYQAVDMASVLSGSWSIDEAYLDDTAVAAARGTLLGALNEGVALASYVGHSSLFGWTGDGLFTVEDAKALGNYGKPTAVVQFGCYNTYYVDPNVNSLAHRLLLSGTNGAAVVSGATVLPGAFAEYELGMRMMPLLSTPGMTIGAAIQEAKTDLAETYPSLLDVLLGYTILGDPTIEVAQPR